MDTGGLTEDTEARSPLLMSSLLAVEQLSAATFRGATTELATARRYPRLFGGLVVAQALRAAQLTTPADHDAHSLHGLFLSAGTYGPPVEYSVEQLRDGSAFSARRVTAVQEGRAVFSMLASLQRPEPGPEYQSPAPDAPDPESVPDGADQPHPDHPSLAPFEIREIAVGSVDRGAERGSCRRFWARLRAPLDAAESLHAAALGYLSDIGPLTAAAASVGIHWTERRHTASLNHSIHFHRPIRLDEWTLVDMQPVSNSGARGLVHVSLHSRDGRLGATVAQEGLVRISRPS